MDIDKFLFALSIGGAVAGFGSAAWSWLVAQAAPPANPELPGAGIVVGAIAVLSALSGYVIKGIQALNAGRKEAREHAAQEAQRVREHEAQLRAYAVQQAKYELDSREKAAERQRKHELAMLREHGHLDDLRDWIDAARKRYPDLPPAPDEDDG